MPLRPIDKKETLSERVNRITEQMSSPENELDFMTREELAVDVIDRPNEVEVVADLPGFDKNDIRIKGNNRTITITAEKSEEKEEKDEIYFVKERTQRTLKRRVSLPVEVNIGDAESRYNNGVLTILIPKTDEKELVDINIK